MPPNIARPIPLLTPTIAALALATLAPGFSEAQERAGVGGRSSVPVLNEPASISIRQTVSLRIHPKSSEEANVLKDSLARQQGVSEVKLSDDLRTLRCAYQGSFGDLPKLEPKTSGFLLSPARIVLALTRNPAKERCKTCGVDEHLRAVGGVASVVVKGSRAELYADLELLDPRKVAEAAESAGYQVEIQSHAWWIVTLEGDAAGVPEVFSDMRGILKIKRAGSEARLLALRALPPEAIMNAALKAGLKATAARVSP